ncbi:hypothetical protein BRD03_01165 [Halobacteriales archaeon QS_9_68_17]|nr:MAG: hypothetical protein BRD03_01165 [Halobacteriales archaeon QS_9_68_17]
MRHAVVGDPERYAVHEATLVVKRVLVTVAADVVPVAAGGDVRADVVGVGDRLRTEAGRGVAGTVGGRPSAAVAPARPSVVTADSGLSNTSKCSSTPSGGRVNRETTTNVADDRANAGNNP